MVKQGPRKRMLTKLKVAPPSLQLFSISLLSEKSPLLLLSSSASRKAPLSADIPIPFPFSLLFVSSSASHSLLPATHPICRPRAAHLRAVRENPKNNNNPQKAPAPRVAGSTHRYFLVKITLF